MYEFDEKALMKDLATLSPVGKVIFTVACVSRLLPAYEEFGEQIASNGYAVVSECVEYLWAFEQDDPGVVRGCEMRLRLIERLHPDENDPRQATNSLFVHAQNTVAMVLYSLETALSNSAQNAVWVAMRAYNSMVAHEGKKIEAGVTSPETEEETLGSSFVQTELSRQQRDVLELQQLNSGNEAGMKIAFRQRALNEFALR